MDITDYIPNIFGAAAPTSYDGLQTMGLITPQQLAQQQKTANIQGLLGAGLALAQGMSRTGPRRSAAENILGALSGGFGAASGAYQQGIQNVVQQQQLQSAALQQAQATNRLKAIQQASQQNPQLAQLFAINPEEAAKQLILQRRAERYASLIGGTPTDTIPQQGQVVPESTVPQVPVVQTTATPTTQVSPVNQQPTPAVTGQTTPTPQLVDPAAVQKATNYRRAAMQATLEGDIPTANFYNSEANRIDPPESITFRDGMAFSSKRGILGRFTEYKRLTKEEIAAEGLPANKIWQRGPDNRIYAVEGSDVTPQLNKQQLIASLPTQANNVYKTLKPRFDALVKRAPGLTADQINTEVAAILEADSKILADLDPTLQSAEIQRRKAGATVLYPVNSMPLGKEGANKVDTQLLDLGQSRLRLQSIASNFNPKYLETPFKLRMEAVAQLEKLGQKPSAQDAADLAAYSEFAQNAYNELNAYINLITGAAVGSGDEEARLRKGVPDPQKDSPTQFFTKLNTKIKEGRLYEARLGYIKNKGMKITDAGLVDVNQIPTMMRNREAEIKNNKTLFGGKNFDAKDPNHKAIVRSILSKEFGLVD
jgi:hypothetical protein